MIEKTVIIGHGASLQNSGQGENIDAFKYVVRFPYIGDWQAPADYGIKTSYVCATVGRARNKLRRQIPEVGYFIWNKTRGEIPSDLKSLIGFFGGENMTELITGWQKKMLKLKPKYSCFSHGTAAICVMAHKFGLPIVVLGCENLAAGENDPKKYHGGWYYEKRKQPINGHDLAAERKMVDLMAKKYNLKIGFKLND
jgi:hypothetical protein